MSCCESGRHVGPMQACKLAQRRRWATNNTRWQIRSISHSVASSGRLGLSKARKRSVAFAFQVYFTWPALGKFGIPKYGNSLPFTHSGIGCGIASCPITHCIHCISPPVGPFLASIHYELRKAGSCRPILPSPGFAALLLVCRRLSRSQRSRSCVLSC